MSPSLVGIDIGGTSAKLGLLSDRLELLQQMESISTSALKSGDDLVDLIEQRITSGLKKERSPVKSLGAIGIGAPGPLDLDTGRILDTPNMKFLRNYPLKEQVGRRMGVPTSLDNDANVFALAEAQAGAAKGLPYVLAVTLGTGFGWGIVLRGKIYHGATGTAAEYGPTLWKDGLSWEDYVSSRGVLRIFRENGGEAHTAAEVYDLAAGGDVPALKTWVDFGQVLGLSLAHGVNLLDPHAVVVGGAIAGAWDFFHAAMMASLRENIHRMSRRQLKVFPSKLGKSAGVIGAAALAMEEHLKT